MKMDRIIVFLLSDINRFYEQIKTVNEDSIILIIIIFIVVKFIAGMLKNSYFIQAYRKSKY
jgi:hypothetical protein